MQLTRLSHVLITITLVSLLAVFAFGGCTATTDDSGRNSPAATIEKIDARAALELIRQNEGNADFVILDVRTPQEYSDERLANSVNLDFYSESFRDELNELDKTKTYVVYCRSGNRSGQAIAIMEELGFQQVYDAGGIVEWKKQGFPTEK